MGRCPICNLSANGLSRYSERQRRIQDSVSTPVPKTKTIKVNVGAVTVRIYPTAPGWTVTFKQPDGARKRVWRSDLTEARTFAG
jgi:hypothetical protein